MDQTSDRSQHSARIVDRLREFARLPYVHSTGECRNLEPIPDLLRDQTRRSFVEVPGRDWPAYFRERAGASNS